MGQRVVDGSGDIDVHLVTHELTRTSRPRLAIGPALGRRRSATGWLATVGVALLTAILHWARGWHDLPLDVLLFSCSRSYRRSLAASGRPSPPPCWEPGLNWFFTPPLYTFTISDPQNLVVLLVYIVVALAVSSAVHLSDRRAAAAQAARQGAALAQSAETLLAERDQLPALLRQVVEFFSMEGAAVARRAKRA